MGLKIDIDLTALPSVTGLPATIKLRQTLQSSFPGGEAARLTYTVNGGGKVVFAGGSPTFQVDSVHVPNNQLTREDSVGLIWIGGAPSPLQVVIDQEIVGVENTVHDSVVIAIP